MKTLKSKTGIIFMVLLAGMSALMLGCGGSKLSDSFEEDAVKEKAKAVVEYMGAEDYDIIYDMFSENLQEVLPADALKENVDANLADRGAYKEISNIAVIGQKNKDTKEDMAVAVAVTSYENQKITYTITFNTDMELEGFFMK